MGFVKQLVANFLSQCRKNGFGSTVETYTKNFRFLAGQKIADYYDLKTDMKICGIDLTKSVVSVYREKFGATNSQPTRYPILDVIFGGEKFSPDDSFIDIGCAKGRVLAYMIKSGFPGKITGIELNPEVAEYARSWTDKYPNITLISGNVFETDLNDYNIFYLFKPMEYQTFIEFIGKIEKELKHPIKFYVLNDNGYLNGRPGWETVKAGVIDRIKGIRMYRNSLKYVIRTYEPLTDNQ